MPPHLRDGLEDAFGVPLIEAYGMSECPQIWSNPPQSPRAGSVGCPVVEELAILGADGTPLPAGEWGEVAVGGAPLMAGYLADPPPLRESPRRCPGGMVGSPPETRVDAMRRAISICAAARGR